MQENRDFSLRNRKEPWRRKPRVMAGFILMLTFLVHFSILGVFTALYTRPDYRTFWWFPALLGAMCLYLLIRLCIIFVRRHLPNAMDA